MQSEFFKKVILRHLEETSPLIAQFTDELFNKKASDETREMAELILHMLRSFEYYFHGIVTNEWKIVPYTIENYSTSAAIHELYEKVSVKIEKYFEKINDNMLNEEVTQFSRPATKTELLTEVLEHSLHHRGQLTVYLRLNGIKPAHIKYII